MEVKEQRYAESGRKEIMWRRGFKAWVEKSMDEGSQQFKQLDDAKEFHSKIKSQR
jgi:hypothetical protein